MSSWTSRLGNLGRFSPFTRVPPKGPAEVSDADFSYITAEDLRRHQAESENHGSPAEQGPPRDTDVLVLRNKKKDFTVHFPAYSIEKGELTIGQVRDQAAKKIGSGDPRSVKLICRGKNLKDDLRTCQQEGLRNGTEILCTVAEGVPVGGLSDSEGDDADGTDEQATPDGEPRRRRNRGKKTKRRNKREEQRDNGDSATASAAQPPKPQNVPTTPIEKINALRDTLRVFEAEVETFQQSPPADPAKKEFEHKRLSETILTQVLLKLDAVETEGDADARTRRKELVKETQKVLSNLDASVKS